jgi:hypothetical protein
LIGSSQAELEAMNAGLEQAESGAAANVVAGARNQGWSRRVALAMIEAARERETLRSLGVEVTT